jgi:4-hydroxybenzoate polyprenyltransferase
MREALYFLIHLRLHYQLFILSGPFLLAGVYAPDIGWTRFIEQFLVVQILLFGGATAFNSFWDRDTGPVGGLRHPPPMQPWMRWASMGLQWLGLLLAMPLGSVYVSLYTTSMILFWLYSTPLARWKGLPHLSLVVVGVSTGVNPFLMGCVAATRTPPDLWALLTGLGVASILVSMYPVSQVFQMEEDGQRNDVTFALRHGINGVRYLFVGCYYAGCGLVVWTLTQVASTLAAIVIVLGGVGGLVTAWHLWHLEGMRAEYDRVMRLKYFNSFVFVGFIVAVLVLRDLGISGQ